MSSLRVLVFSKTAGYRHESIEAGVESLRKLAEELQLQTEFTEDSGKFTDEGLRGFDVVVFLNTTGDVLDEDQESAFERFIRSGNGYVGIHGASDTEYGWPWYGKLVGAYFSGHPAIQEAVVTIEDPNHPTTSILPQTWIRTDEWYAFHSNPRDLCHILATVDEGTYQGGTMGADHPIMWCHDFDGGRAWYTALGHQADIFEDPRFMESLHQGIRWAANKL